MTQTIIGTRKAATTLLMASVCQGQVRSFWITPCSMTNASRVFFSAPRVSSGRPDDTRGALRNTLDALVIEQGVIQKLRTWPWQTEAISSVVAAFLVPMIVWVIQRLLQRL